MNRKQHADEAGYVAERCNPVVSRGQRPTAKVTIYLAAAQGIAVGGCKYAVVCDAHGSIAWEHDLRSARASMHAPQGFCGQCREILELRQ